MAVNEQGYMRPTYEDLLEGRIALAQELFGDDIDVSADSALGKFIRLSIQDLADAYEAQEIIYYSRFPNTAEGTSLDRLMPFAGITRNAATRAEHSVMFFGTAGATIEAGFLVGTAGDEEFYLVNDLTLDDSGSGIGTVACTELGEVGNVALGTITEIVNPTVDVTSVSHQAVVSSGAEIETDAELRDRFSQAIEGSGSATMSSIKGAVLRVGNVKSCVVVENDTNETVNGIPPHGFEVFVHAPTSANQAIAEAIFSKKPIGIPTAGDLSETVTDVSGGTHTVRFSRVAETPIYINVTVQINAEYELDGQAQIKDALVAYVDELEVGDNVILSRMYKQIFNVAGVVDVSSLTLSTDNSTFTAANVAISTDRVATLIADNIVVTEATYTDED